MAVLKKIKKSLRDLVIGTSLAASVLAPGCIHREPVKVKAYADGVMSVDEKATISEMLENQDTIEDFDQVKGLINDIDVFMGNELAAEGYDDRRIKKNLEIYLAADSNELEAIYEMDGTPGDIFSAEMPEGTPAFFSNLKTRIYMLKGHELPTFLNIFHHEDGHYFVHGRKEISAEMNRIFAWLKLSKFDSELGSMMLSYALGHTPGRIFIDEKRGEIVVTERLDGKPVENSEKKSHLLMYTAAYLTDLIMINEAEGDVASAYNTMSKLSTHKLRKKLFERLSSSGTDLRSVWAEETEKLINQEKLRSDLESVLSTAEVDGMINFLKFRRLSLLERTDRNDGFDTSLYDEDLGALASYFLDREGNVNPQFSAQVAFDYTMILDNKFNNLIHTVDGVDETITPEAANGLVDIARRIIEVNRRFPCSGSYFECPTEMKDVRKEHAEAYARALYWLARNGETINMGEAMGLADDFLTRFFPDGDYTFDTNFPTSSMKALAYLPQVGTSVLNIASTLSPSATDAETLSYKCIAERVANAMVDASCGNVEDAGQRVLCLSLVDDHASEARTALESLAGSCDALYAVPKGTY